MAGQGMYYRLSDHCGGGAATTFLVMNQIEQYINKYNNNSNE
jgi:galactitol-specific phosphotransferase system IIB component